MAKRTRRPQWGPFVHYPIPVGPKELKEEAYCSWVDDACELVRLDKRFTADGLRCGG